MSNRSTHGRPRRRAAAGAPSRDENTGLSGRCSTPPADVLSVAQLEQSLWSAADILRGSIDSSDYKSYIFGLLFLKRLSDRFEEEAEKLIAEGLPESVAWTDPDEHQFFVPERARWSAIQRRATNIGETLNKACAALEEQNGALEGVLAGIDYNDERKLGDARNRDTVLARLVRHFSQVPLRNDRMAEPDLLGRAYEYLIEHFADDAGKKGGEFYTPRMVVGLIVELLAPAEGMRICDPTAGSGGMLIECAHHVEGKGGNPRNLTLPRPRRRARGPDLPSLCRRGEVRAGGAARRDRAQRLEPERQPLRGHLGGGGTHRRRGGGAQAPGAGRGARGSGGGDEPVSGGAGV